MTYVSRQKRAVQDVFDEMLSHPRKPHKVPEDFDYTGVAGFPKEFSTLTQACTFYGVEVHLMSSRLRRGYSFDDALSEVQSIAKRGPRLDKSNLGLPIEVDGVVCKEIKDVAEVLGITGSCLCNFLRKHQCTMAEAVAHYQTFGVRLTGRSSEDIAATHIAYIGIDGNRYSYAVCKVCNSIMLLNSDTIRGFKHGGDCQKYAIPETFVIPSIMAKMKHVYPSIIARYNRVT